VGSAVSREVGGKDWLQCAQSNDKLRYANLRSEEVTGGTKIKAWISVHSRTNAVVLLTLLGAAGEALMQRFSLMLQEQPLFADVFGQFDL
jgi:hypothetical protein